MINQTIEPMVKHSNQVHTTTDYFMFKTLNGNRDINQLHLTRLKESFKKDYLTTIMKNLK